MAIRKTPQRMTKKEFLKMVDELQRYEQKYGIRSELFYALGNRIF
jgi:hypothetical protein